MGATTPQTASVGVLVIILIYNDYFVCFMRIVAKICYYELPVSLNLIKFMETILSPPT